MSAYPPPPPGQPPPGPPPPPGQPPGQPPLVGSRYDYRVQQQTLKAQQRAWKAQQRMLRAQGRMQQRAARRGSIVGPLLILAVGIVFLLGQLGRITWSHAFAWYARWWPAVLVVAGLVLLAEWAVDQNSPRPGGPRSIGGGIVLLLIVLAFFGVFLHAWRALDAFHSHWSPDHLDAMLGDRHDEDSQLSPTLSAGGALAVRNPHGDVTVTGDSADGLVHVSVHKETYAWRDGDAETRAERLQPAFSNDGKDMTLSVPSVEGGQADLTLQVPRGTALTIQADHGDIKVSALQAALTLSANHGDVDLDNISGPVTLHVNHDNASITARALGGALTIDGRSGDIDASDVAGAVTLHGDFFGETQLERIGGAVSFETSRTAFHAARLDGDFTVGKDGLDASAVLGPLTLKTADKNVTLDRVQGPVEITDRNGSVEMTHTPPMASVQITNTHGSVDVALPDNAGFTLHAQTRNGDLENDFGLSAVKADAGHSLDGRVGTGGPAVTITTSDGDVTVRKTTVEPLPPAPPAAPAAPGAPEAPKAPRPPHPPRLSQAPASVTF